jgi:hypothetical protein
MDFLCDYGLNQPINSRVGAFFSRQDDRPGAFNGQKAIAAKKGKTRSRFLFE